MQRPKSSPSVSRFIKRIRVKKSYIVCALAAVLCSVSMASTPALPAGHAITATTSEPVAANGVCSHWLGCAFRRLTCVNGKYSEVPLYSDSTKSMWVCVA